MDPKRVEDLVYVHTNLRLLSRKEDGYKKGQSRMWDISGDAHEPLDSVALMYNTDDALFGIYCYRIRIVSRIRASQLDVEFPRMCG
ncbi:hypothetical protein MTR_5g072600 [Medicago truncatula]|uniref:Uncharacterized protein n=1 Tax=Medicago truncatula TaxID=3880 RepID=G7KEC1_MEDTR|nr:hypothetical protein MTR_5g072600 [Medicago truncatula]